MQMMETIGCYKIIFPATKTFFSVFTQMCFQKFIAEPKKEVLTSKVIFTLYLKPKRGRKMEKMGKNPRNYESIKKETNIYEQKPINIDDFNEAEEAEVKQLEKRKQKRREIAEKNKL